MYLAAKSQVRSLNEDISRNCLGLARWCLYSNQLGCIFFLLFGRFLTEKSVKYHFQDKTLKDKYTHYVMKNGGWTWNAFSGIGLGIDRIH